MPKLHGLCRALLLTAMLPFEAARADGEASDRHALLVGVPTSRTRARRFHLEGPAHDVLLMEELLRVHFGFPARNLTILSEAGGQKDAGKLPTKANIRRECER